MRKPTVAEQAYHDRLCRIVGCIACWIDGHFNDWCSIHHRYGRTKPGCHKKVLSLCAGHHQQGAGEDPHMIARHPNKAAFEAKYGTEADLQAMCDRILEKTAARA